MPEDTIIDELSDDIAGATTFPSRQAALTIPIHMRVNGREHALALDPRTSLLDLLRERLALTGAKKGCDHGQCGACTVHLDGRRVVSCLTLAVQVDGREVTTIEGLAARRRRAASDAAGLHRSRRAAVRLLHAGADHGGRRLRPAKGTPATPEQIREYMSGNICRCGAYVGIVAAIQDAAAEDAEGLSHAALHLYARPSTRGRRRSRRRDRRAAARAFSPAARRSTT